MFFEKQGLFMRLEIRMCDFQWKSMVLNAISGSAAYSQVSMSIPKQILGPAWKTGNSCCGGALNGIHLSGRK